MYKIKMNNILYTIIVFIVLITAAFSTVYAEESLEDKRNKIKNEIVKKEAEIINEQKKLNKVSGERKGVEVDIVKLKKRIHKAENDILKRKRMIRSFNNKIHLKRQSIDSLSSKMEKERSGLSQLLRQLYVYDDMSIVELFLSGKTFSRIFMDFDRMIVLREALHVSYKELRGTKDSLLKEKEILSDSRAEQDELRMIQERQKKDVESDKKVKVSLANKKRRQEKKHKLSITEKKREVAKIRARLFALRESNTKAVSFGKMVQYAKEAGKHTGVNPALILGILTVETNLGKTLGIGKWDEDMHPTRDAPVFKEIVAELGLDPNKMPVSARPCSLAKRRAAGPGKRCGYGYGGAMGPAQFIPSTWILFKDRIATLSGQSPPNPWDPRTAVFATALLMKDNGATRGGRDAEHKAAVRYLAGWRNAEKREYWWYGDKTMRFRDQYMSDIKLLE